MPLTALAAMVMLAAGCASAMRDPEIDQLLRDYQGAVPGASLLVLRDGEIVLQRGYGMADLEAGTPATPSTHYRLASVTKQFTAAAILTLAGRGALSLEDPVRRYLPDLPTATGEVTIRHLLTHTSGLVDYEDVIPEGTARQVVDRDVYSLLAARPSLDFAPGTQYRYSNSGYALLALVVEEVSGHSFAAFLREEIFAPLGMATTVAHEEGISTVRHRAFGHSRKEGKGWKRDDQSLTSAVLGDGGIYSSIEELAAWLRALDAGRFAEASVPRVDTGKDGIRYGYGWRIHEHAGRRVVSHTGETRGFRNALVRFPDDRLAVVLLTNRNEGVPLAIALKVAEKFLR